MRMQRHEIYMMIQDASNDVKGETKAEPRSIGNARTLPPASKVVETQDGLVQGVEGKTDEGKIFHKYLGLPYAEPPLGALRCNFNIN